MEQAGRGGNCGNVEAQGLPFGEPCHWANFLPALLSSLCSLALVLICQPAESFPRASPGVCHCSLSPRAMGMDWAPGKLPIKHQRLWGPGESLGANFLLKGGATEAQR